MVQLLRLRSLVAKMWDQLFATPYLIFFYIILQYIYVKKIKDEGEAQAHPCQPYIRPQWYLNHTSQRRFQEKVMFQTVDQLPVFNGFSGFLTSSVHSHLQGLSGSEDGSVPGQACPTDRSGPILTTLLNTNPSTKIRTSIIFLPMKVRINYFLIQI